MAHFSNFVCKCVEKNVVYILVAVRWLWLAFETVSVSLWNTAMHEQSGMGIIVAHGPLTTHIPYRGLRWGMSYHTDR